MQAMSILAPARFECSASDPCQGGLCLVQEKIRMQCRAVRSRKGAACSTRHWAKRPKAPSNNERRAAIIILKSHDDPDSLQDA